MWKPIVVETSVEPRVRVRVRIEVRIRVRVPFIYMPRTASWGMLLLIVSFPSP